MDTNMRQTYETPATLVVFIRTDKRILQASTELQVMGANSIYDEDFEDD